MELTLVLTAIGQVRVVCDEQESHTFALVDILGEPNNKQENVFMLGDPIEAGRRLFAALFRTETIAHRSLEDSIKRILLVTTDKELDAIPWEYLYGPDGYLALDFDIVRGLPPNQRQPKLDLEDTSLHIVAIPSNPISSHVPPLDIDGEWQRLKEGIEELGSAIVLERTRPPTLEQTHRLIANQKNRILHFMGHGGTTERGSLLYFEDEQGAPEEVTAPDFIRHVEDTTLLVLLNSCEGAKTGPQEFSNIAHALVQRKVPYAIGMRFAIPDLDAKEFSRAFYDELTRGVPVESALRHARQVLADSRNPWAIGIPVLYTSLKESSGGFARAAGTPLVEEHQPPLEVFVLPKAKGAFQGRVDELLALGKALTGEPRVKLLTIHGLGGQGKTTLVREAAERFAYAFPGGVFAVSLETKPNRATFCFQLAQFLKLPTDQLLQLADLERAILTRLHQQRTLIVLDNAETFTEMVREKDKEALDLADFLRERLLSTPSSLLITSREPLGWPGEQVLLLEGLSPREGAALFIQSALQRQKDVQMEQATALSLRLDGHPLALLLLGLAFNETSISLEQFIAEHETRLLQAEDRYRAEDHRHRTLYASIEISVRYLGDEQREILSGLWIFQAPFLPETAAQLFTPDGLSEDEVKSHQEKVFNQLHVLFRRGLLVREVETLAESNFGLYRTLPTVRLFAQHYLEQKMTIQSLRSRFGNAQYSLLNGIRTHINQSRWASYLVIRNQPDLEVGLDCVDEKKRGAYATGLGRVLQRVGVWRDGLKYLEYALEEAQENDQELEVQALSYIAELYGEIGRPGRAIQFFEKALLPRHVAGNRQHEAATLNNMAAVYRGIGKREKALELYEQALVIMREVEDRDGEATIINNIAEVRHIEGQPDYALELFEQAMHLMRKLGNRSGQAGILHNVASIYRDMGQSIKALQLYEQALSLAKDVSDRSLEANSLKSMAHVHERMGQIEKALEFYEEALLIKHEVGDRAGEIHILQGIAGIYLNANELDKSLVFLQRALPIISEIDDRRLEGTTLSNAAWVYHHTGDPDTAIRLYKQALPIRRGVGDRVGEANTLNNMAYVYQDKNELDTALELYEQALFIWREVGDLEGELQTSLQMALLFRELREPQRALDLMHHVVQLKQRLQHSDSVQYAALMAKWKIAVKGGKSLSGASVALPLSLGLSKEKLHIFQNGTLRVLTKNPEKRAEWRELMINILADVEAANSQMEIEFFSAIVALLDDEVPEIPADNPYAELISSISHQMTHSEESRTIQEDSPLPSDLPPDFVARCVAGLKGSPEQREALFEYLREVNRKTSSREVSTLTKNIQFVLFGKNPPSLTPALPEPYAAVWRQIINDMT